MNVIPAKVREQLDNASQSHLLLFWDELSASQRTSLLNQIDGTDLKMLDQIWRSSINDDSPLDATARIESAKSPGQVVGQPQSAADIDRWKQATRLGERELEAGSVAVITDSPDSTQDQSMGVLNCYPEVTSGSVVRRDHARQSADDPDRHGGR